MSRHSVEMGLIREYKELKKDTVAYSIVYTISICVFYLAGIVLGELQSGAIERVYKLGGVIAMCAVVLGSALVIFRNWTESKSLCLIMAAFVISTLSRHLLLFPDMVSWILTDMSIVLMVMFLFMKNCRGQGGRKR